MFGGRTRSFKLDHELASIHPRFLEVPVPLNEDRKLSNLRSSLYII